MEAGEWLSSVERVKWAMRGEIQEARRRWFLRREAKRKQEYEELKAKNEAIAKAAQEEAMVCSVHCGSLTRCPNLLTAPHRNASKGFKERRKLGLL